ncbi:putative monovalent cation/H+ antiporter subunit A [Gellertiella hungarica]|uniref:Multicomponent Na+:H+ antiporter subunit A n=1 Tax=Gellertiella hungarica TaxID=1572859 RepID=A0A7W6NKS5_9HYPH|nr:putative monovalent cation/H+ antiporter subunit A [Gellertiella hungarica]MBB4065765.1 multicomponent Na+:H+ antiporter subunit A [Gellertiella hungarica]
MELTFLALLTPFIAALFAPALTRVLGARAAFVLVLAPILSFARLLTYLPDVMAGEKVTGGFAWVPSFNLSYSWYLDGLSLTFALLVTGIGALIVLYAGAYLKGHPQQGRFFAFLLAFMGAMLGLVVSDSFLMLFIHWELTSITSFLLIGFDHERQASRRAALTALAVTGGGGLFLLAGLMFLWNITGVTQFSLLLMLGDDLRSSPFYMALFGLIAMAAFTKSAQFPFHFWLPNAMAAPTPVSAYLHSATMVKAGVFLLMRLNPVMGGTPLWTIVLPVVGGVTLIAGTVMALRQRDMKLVLAQTTVASLGLLVMLTGFGTEKALEAAVLYLLAHALFKGALFMVAGQVDHGAGSRDLTEVSGLYRAMPLTGAAAGLAALSMIGFMPFAGFLAKEEIYAALSSGSPRDLLFLMTAFAGNVLMGAAALHAGISPFRGRLKAPVAHPHEGPFGLLAGPVLLSLAGLAAGVASGQFHRAFGNPMASAVAGHPVEMTISGVPHAGLPFALSVVTIAAAAWLFSRIGRVQQNARALIDALGPGPDRAFDTALDGLTRMAHGLVRRVQSGRLEHYLVVTLLCLGLTLLLSLALQGEMPRWPALGAAIPPAEALVLLLALTGVGVVLVASDRLTAIVALGIQGFAVGLIYLLYGAPDLAFTQFMVETLAVVILTLVMTRLNLKGADHRGTGERLVDGAVAVLAAAGLGLLMLKMLEGSFDGRLSDFFNLYSRTVAHGANVVNVIIVDFRGTDTLGEISVVLVTGLAILALIRLRAVAGRRRLADNDPADAEEQA